MAKATSSGWDEAYRQLERLGKKTPATMQKMLAEGAKVYKDATLYAIADEGLIDSGTLYGSVKVDRIKAERDGFSTDVYPMGNRLDEKHPSGERNETIAFVLEYDEARGGWMDKAAADAEEPAIEAMMKVLEAETDGD